jgi:hypothetical protein
MTTIFSSFLSDLLNDAVSAFDSGLMWILSGMLYVEKLTDTSVSSIVTSSVISSLYQFVYKFAGGLLLLKFLFKGFEIYILWRDGDPDNSPQDMLIGGIEGTVFMLCFPYLYDIMAGLTMYFATDIMGRLGLSDGAVSLDPSGFSFTVTTLFLLILLVVYVILLVYVMIKLIQRGFELLILRLGVPIACMGLVDSDKGLFKGYMQTFFKTMFTSVIQIAMLSLSLRIIVTPSLPNIICGIAAIATALGTPLLLQNILIPTGGGGLGQKVYSAGMAAGAIRRILGR